MVKPAFAFALESEFLTRVSRPLGAPDIFSGAYRPSLTAHLMLFFVQVSNVIFKGWCPIGAPQLLAKLLRRSHLRCTPKTTLQHQAAVNLRGVFSSRWDFPAYSLGKQVHQVQGRDSGNLVISLVQAGIQPARYYATVRASELGPLFTSA